ncbi:PHP domain-containing protein [Frankia sp. AgPm24]|uniref:PHP domain-containing protein n=1 Tax=Frankia sp. AgPm24 TaxID=631128 RepID=UPI00200EE621|nr:PHP domain-containing protein [Frankia sp. AgPm24]MCK9923331.1 PHP domain-containing protein [Frankia sp. AgPm24]
MTTNTGIDLHVHSCRSIGSALPGDLAAQAAAAGLHVIAITDHNTVDGVAEAEAALPLGLTLLPGVEVSCAVDLGVQRVPLSLLAYLCNPRDRILLGILGDNHDEQERQVRKVLRDLQNGGHALTWEDVATQAGHRRPSIADVAGALVTAGLAGTLAEALSSAWLGGQYAPRRRRLPSARQTLHAIRGAGGVPVLAYARWPGRLNLTADDLKGLHADGLAGLEVDHPTHRPDDRQELRGIAHHLGLIITGGSGHHGDGGPALGAETTSTDAYHQIVRAGHGTMPILGTAVTADD